MKVLRIIGAAFLVLLGAMLLVGWNVAGKTVGAIESGEAATNLTQKLLDDPNFADGAATRITNRLVERTEGNIVGRLVSAFQPEIKQAIVRVLESDQVNDAVTKSVSKVEEQLTAELTDPNRPSGPFVISIDLSDRVNARIDQIPVIGGFIPDVTVPPVERELIDAKTFDSVRQVYGGIKFVASWGLFIGVLFIVAGFFVAPRSRWYWPQAILGTGILVLGVSIVIRRVIPSQIAGAVPGGEGGGTGTFLKDFLNDNATGPIASRLLAMALWALLLAVIFGVVARMLPGWRDQFIPAKVVVVEPVAAFVAPEGVPSSMPDAVVAESVSVASAPVTSHAQVVDTVVIESPASSPATAPEEAAESAEPAEPVEPAEAAAVAEPAAAKAPARKPAAAKPAATKAAEAKVTEAKVTPAKATPAKKPASASGTPAPKPTRTRKPTTPKE